MNPTLAFALGLILLVIIGVVGVLLAWRIEKNPEAKKRRPVSCIQGEDWRE